MKPALCLICRYPNDYWLNFLGIFINYNIFIIIDDNTSNYVEKYSEKYKNINIIQINNEECVKKGYYNGGNIKYNDNYLNEKTVMGWDKAIYYFSEIYKDYENVWFIEDDVFFYNEDVLIDIDNKYIGSDLLTESNHVSNDDGMNGWYHWFHVYMHISAPRSRSMVCACRLSKKLLNEISLYIEKNGFMFYIESLFNTIAHQSNLIISTPSELSTITWANKWDINEIDYKNIYHPMKNLEEHYIIRNNKSRVLS
jgi:hypothetical protein